MTHRYTIAELVPLIAWPYLHHAWGLPPGAADERAALEAEARERLDAMAAGTEVLARAVLLPAWREGDDIVVLTQRGSVRLPMLRQQRPDSDGLCHCLADYLPTAPRPGEDSGAPASAARHIGLFVTTVRTTIADGDLLGQTLADRLAEAAAERLHAAVRRTFHPAGANAAERPSAQSDAPASGIRPAVGYPSLPDLSLHFVLEPILRFGDIGVRLTESGMMQPHASVCGLIIDCPQARYFDIRSIRHDQFADYARRRRRTEESLMPFLGPLLI